MATRAFSIPRLDKQSVQRKPKPRKFYIMSYGYREKRSDFDVENLDVLRGSALSLSPPKGRRGFPVYPENPIVVIGKLGKRKASPPTDIEFFHAYWLISDRLKRLFEELDPEAFAFQACDVWFADDSPGPAHWLCDVVRVLDAFDQSTADELRKRPYLGLLGRALAFNEAAIGSALVFCVPNQLYIFADQGLKDACRQAGIKGTKFTPCFKK